MEEIAMIPSDRRKCFLHPHTEKKGLNNFTSTHCQLPQIVVPLTKERNYISRLPNFSAQIAFLPGEFLVCVTENFIAYFSDLMK